MNRPLETSHRVFLPSERVLPSVARALLGAWLLPVVFALVATFAAKPAHAQPQPAPANLVILDFDVAPGIDPVLGRKAADALAVELKASQNYEVVPRSRVETAVANEPGLRAPFTPQTQVRLAQRTGASGVISGRVIQAVVNNRKSARVTIEARQLDVATGDVVNGAQISETTLDKLQEVDNDILLDEAINKVSFAIVRAMKNTTLPEGTVLNTTNRDVELNLGTRNGLAVGQRYSVLRDVQNKATGVVERIKVAEISITKLEADQSIAVVTAGGDAGVKTGDKVRQIFVPRAASYPVSSSGTSNSLQLPPPPKPPGASKASRGFKGLGGLAALALAVGLAGLGGSGSRDAAFAPPRDVIARPVYTVGGSGTLPSINATYDAGIPGILGGENILGYFIYRGETPDFGATIQNLTAFVEGRSQTFTEMTAADPENVDNQRGFTVTITSTNTNGNGGGGNNGGNNGGGTTLTDPIVTIVEFDPATAPTTPITPPANNNGSLSEVIIRRFISTPPLPGKQYFYAIQRVTAVTTLPADPVQNNDNNDNNNGGNNNGNNGNNNGTGERRVARLSRFSGSSGGATAAVRPTISAVTSNLSNFSVTLAAVSPAIIEGGGVADINEVTVQVRISAQGATAANPGAGNFVSQTFQFPGGLGAALDGQGQVTLNFGNGVFIPNFRAGDDILVRVGIRNDTDSPGPAGSPFLFARGNTGTSNPNFEFIASGATAQSVASSRFVPEGGAGQRRIGGAGLPGSSRGGAGRLGGARRSPGGILRPR